MAQQEQERLTVPELHELFDRLFPCGFGGADVLAEVAPDRWDQSPLLACFHPSVERVLEESLQVRRNIASLQRAGHRHESSDVTTRAPEPTLEQIRLEQDDLSPTPSTGR